MALLKELGFDAAWNHKEVPIRDALAKHCPDGIDIYFGAQARGGGGQG